MISYRELLVVTTVESPLEDPDEEDGDKSNDYSPQKDLALINLACSVMIIIILLDEIRLESKQKEPNNDTDDEEPKEVEPPSISVTTVFNMISPHAIF